MVKVWRPHYQESKEVINMEKNTVNHSAHFTYSEKNVEIIEAEASADHIHMLVSIPPHLSVAQFMGYLKEKKYTDDIRPARKPQVQVWKSALLVPRLLCRHGGKE